MSAELDTTLSKIEAMLPDELLALRSRIDARLQNRHSRSEHDEISLSEKQKLLGKNGLPMYGKWGNILPGHPDYKALPSAYQLTIGEAKTQANALLGSRHTPEEIEAIRRIDVSDLPEPVIPLSQSLNEDREDRF